MTWRLEQYAYNIYRRGSYKGRYAYNIYRRALLLQQFVNVVNVVERIVDEEFQFGDDAQLIAQATAQLVAQFAHIAVDILQYLGRALRREDAEIAAAHAEVGTDTYGADRYEYAVEGGRLFLEYIAQFLLDEARDFLLSGGIHSMSMKGE